MALHAAEEESIEALKKWWDDNGTMVTVVVVARGLVVGRLDVLAKFHPGHYGGSI